MPTLIMYELLKESTGFPWQPPAAKLSITQGRRMVELSYKLQSKGFENVHIKAWWLFALLAPSRYAGLFSPLLIRYQKTAAGRFFLI